MADIGGEAIHTHITVPRAAAVVEGVILDRGIGEESRATIHDNGIRASSGAGTIKADERVVYNGDVVYGSTQIIIKVHWTKPGRLVHEDVVSENQIRHGGARFGLDHRPLGIDERDSAGQPIIGPISHIVFEGDVRGRTPGLEHVDMRACARPLEAPVVADICKVDVVNVVFANHIAGAEEPYAIRVCAGSGGRPRRVLNRMADIIAFNHVIDSLHPPGGF